MSEPMLKIFTGGLTKSLTSDGRKVVHTTASSAVEDLHGDLIEEECIHDMVSQVNDTGLAIFLNHSYNLPEDLFGTAYEASAALRTDKKGLAAVDMDLDIEVNEANPRAIQMWEALPDPGKKRGMKVGTSIGANVLHWEYRDTKKGRESGLLIKRLALLEASIVGIPANPRSWVQYAKDALKEFEPDIYVLNNTGSIVPMGDIEVGEAGPERFEVTEPEEIVAAAGCATCGHGADCDCTECDCSTHGDGADDPSDIISSAEPEEEEQEVDPDWEQTHLPEFDGLEEYAAALIDGKIAESHPELPDSAFACIDAKGRHYPHHTSSGAVDKALLRNALSRIGDASNTQCGKGHLNAHARSLGIGDRKDDEPEAVTSETPALTASMDEETREGDAVATELVSVEETTPVVDLDEVIESVKAMSTSEDQEIVVRTVVGILGQVSAELSSTRSENAELIETIQSLIKERDEAITSFNLAAEIVDQIAKQPLARKTRFAEPIKSFKRRFEGYGYSDGFLNILERSQSTHGEGDASTPQGGSGASRNS